MPKVVIDYTKCTVSKQCLEVCPTGVFEMQGDKMVVAREEDCTACRLCEQSCPCGAITVTDD
jgi:NAD-dependent dihydropyrimidine dehydrogenase PreA subunit